MALMKLDFLPGVNKENTPYSVEGGWVDSDKIRFRSGKPEKIGGWEKYIDTQLTGVPRSSHVFRTLDSTIYLAIGTNSKVYVETGGLVLDITPIRETQALTDPFTTTAGSAVITVTDVAHGAKDGAFVTISGSADVDGIPAAEINAEHQITYVDVDTYTITVTTTGSAGATGGGASVSAAYQINPGQADGAYQYGWGVGVWGAGTWGTARSSAVTTIQPRIWSFANWGEDLIINPRGGSLYYWDATNPTDRATLITQAPHKVNTTIVTKDRHLVCFGCNEAGSANSGTALDALQIRWSNQEDYTDWTVTVTNTAGDQLLTNGTEIMAAANTENQVVVWTDDDVQSMQYIGPPYTFGFTQIGTESGLISPNAWVAYNNVLLWMGESAFYIYQGGTNVLPCTVQRFVFDDINPVQKRKIYASLDRENHEISWFYPTLSVEDTELNGDITAAATTITVATTAGYEETGTIQIGSEYITYTGKTDASFTGCTRAALGSTAVAHSDGDVVSDATGGPCNEPSRYVSFHVVDKLWWVGRLERTTWVDRGPLKYPVATSHNGYLYNHDIGYDADSEPLFSYIESADFDIGEGDQVMFVHRVFPDFTLTGSVDLKMKSRNYPLNTQVKETVGTVSSATSKIDTRIRGRQLALRIESGATGAYWKYGSTRIEQRPDGRR